MHLEDMNSETISNPEILSQNNQMKILTDVANAVIEARKKNHLTQQQLADRTGIDRADISKLESGHTNPTLSLLKRLAQGMDMTLKLEFLPKE